ncbi:unknown [Prevotella sp. CAG:592]|nr:unknown [Prevotella sp. CAG:592]
MSTLASTVMLFFIGSVPLPFTSRVPEKSFIPSVGMKWSILIPAAETFALYAMFGMLNRAFNFIVPPPSRIVTSARYTWLPPVFTLPESEMPFGILAPPMFSFPTSAVINCVLAADALKLMLAPSRLVSVRLVRYPLASAFSADGRLRLSSRSLIRWRFPLSIVLTVNGLSGHCRRNDAGMPDMKRMRSRFPSDAFALRERRPGQESLKALRSMSTAAFSHESGVLSSSCGIFSLRESIERGPFMSAICSPPLSFSAQWRITSFSSEVSMA